MKLKVYLEREEKSKIVELNNATVKNLLEKLGINSVTVIVVKNGEVCVEDAKLNAKDKVKIISIVSSG